MQLNLINYDKILLAKADGTIQYYSIRMMNRMFKTRKKELIKGIKYSKKQTNKTPALSRLNNIRTSANEF